MSNLTDELVSKVSALTADYQRFWQRVMEIAEQKANEQRVDGEVCDKHAFFVEAGLQVLEEFAKLQPPPKGKDNVKE